MNQLNRVESRRAFVAALGLVPLALAVGCGSDEPAKATDEPETDSGLSAEKRARYRSTADAYAAACTAHDVETALGLFTPKSNVSVNGVAIEDLDALRAYLVERGASGAGGIEGMRMENERWFFTDDALLVEGRIFGKHVGPVAGYVATNQDVELAFMTFCEVDANGTFTTCETTVNLFALMRVFAV